MDKTKIKAKFKWFFESFIWLALLMLVIDIVTKNVVYHYKNEITSSSAQGIVLIKNFLAIAYTENDKAAFGIGLSNPNASRILYICIATIGTGAMLFYYIKNYNKLKKVPRACLMLLVSGAIGNLIDRLFYKFSNYCVVDWINFYGIWSYIFNIADSCVVVGAILFIIFVIVDDYKEAKKEKLAKANNKEETVNNDTDSTKEN